MIAQYGDDDRRRKSMRQSGGLACCIYKGTWEADIRFRGWSLGQPPFDYDSTRKRDETCFYKRWAGFSLRSNRHSTFMVAIGRLTISKALPVSHFPVAL
ncbi:hypothetical protein PISMIDRAFT_689906 [Pisolithus microcarpus 441]|uniref:Uncharacterized protein n=1 Tax=Pisolithus microcarpus 441 TaxID=765257 RepID=A0A0C9XI68_9AGAM|nr:hypothetical protein PISMIDRAFT_689906 [Pisolithus microcarpus 441]